MPMSVWLRNFSDPIGQETAEMVAALRRFGIDADPAGADGGAPGIVILTTASEAVCRFLRAVAGTSRARMLCLVRAAGAGVRDPWQLLRAGATDVLAWTAEADVGAQVAARLERWRAVDDLSDRLAGGRGSPLVGTSQRWRAVLHAVIEAARFTDANVLLTGESGTGKELVAHLIHDLDARPAKGRLVVLDCTTVVPELSGSEFFGHEKGAFTGAVAQREGAFALADGGTLFLDEVGDLPLRLQAQLLRVIQERTYKRVGGNTWQRTSFRLICATHRDLPEMVRRGSFRGDLYYRIAAAGLRLPPLAERVEDVLRLALHFLAELRPPGAPPPELDGAVADFLLARPYPGNVRELKQLVTRMLYRWVGSGPITLGCIPEDEWRPAAEADAETWNGDAFSAHVRRALASGLGLQDIGRASEEVALRIVLAEEDGNLQRAARRLGVTDRALQMRQARRRLCEAEPGDGPLQLVGGM
jgi:transcriptional regulator with GAF, ATPase, and Fis domain